MLKNPNLSAHYQLRVSREGHLDELAVHVELRQELSGSLPEAGRRAIADEVRHHIKSYIGVSTDVQVVDCGTIERTLVGKARRVVDLRPKS